MTIFQKFIASLTRTYSLLPHQCPYASVPTASASRTFPCTPIMTANRRVAVIGAGASGLSAARALRQEGHSVAVFERSAGIGGTWIYSTAVESDHLSADPNRKIVHSSLYDSLRTNLPRESMGFFDYPFVAVPGEEDFRRFPGHREVLRYLEDFARESGLYGLIRFGVEVVRVEMEGEGRWAVVSRRVVGGGGCGGGGDDSEVFDGVVVCVGHYTEPRVAEIPGIDSWPGKQMHSHNYRVPQPFQGQEVVIIGSAASATDISKDIAGLAKEVHIASRSAPGGTPMKDPAHENIFIHSMIVKAFADGTVLFQDGSSAFVDVIMHCTGYKYHFPFLKTDGIVNVEDNRVGPLYKHVFPPLLAPYLSFIGLTTKIIAFPMFQLQSKWIAGALSGRIMLPTQEEMMEDVKNLYSEMQSAGRPKRYTHNIENYHFEYANWLARECGHPQVEEWRKLMYYANRKNRVAKPDRYRDEWDDDDLVKEAYEHFRNMLISP